MPEEPNHPPVDDTVTINRLTRDPYPVYKRMRAQTPVVKVKSVGRTFLTKWADTKYVKDNPQLFSSNDPNTPMQPAYQAQTLMRKDGPEHMRERMAMLPAYMPKVVQDVWAPLYVKICEEYLGRLERGATVDLYREIAGPVAARILAHILGVPEASDEEMQRWSQILIDGAGNFGWRKEPFAATDIVNVEMNAHFDRMIKKHKAEPGPSALSVMVNADDPIERSQIQANIKIAIGGGINEPRDAFATAVFGLLTNPDQLEEVKRTDAWASAFEESIRWVAPISASSRLVTEDTEIRGCFIPAGDTVMTIQASANHDEEVFENGDLFDVFRKKNPHQAFGSGPHHCAGVHISRRTVGKILLPMIFERFPHMTLHDPSVVQWRGFGFRGPINLPVTLN